MATACCAACGVTCSPGTTGPRTPQWPSVPPSCHTWPFRWPLVICFKGPKIAVGTWDWVPWLPTMLCPSPPPGATGAAEGTRPFSLRSLHGEFGDMEIPSPGSTRAPLQQPAHRGSLTLRQAADFWILLVFTASPGSQGPQPRLCLPDGPADKNFLPGPIGRHFIYVKIRVYINMESKSLGEPESK